MAGRVRATGSVAGDAHREGVELRREGVELVPEGVDVAVGLHRDRRREDGGAERGEGEGYLHHHGVVSSWLLGACATPPNDNSASGFGFF